MKIAYLDTVSGISGDMTLGAFVSAGVRIDDLSSEIGKLHLEGVELECSHVNRNGIAAVKLDVVISSKESRHRHLKDIVSLIDSSTLSDRVKGDAKKIFGELARAEAAVHGTTVEKVHFHEVGALDSIVDIVGAAVCLELSGVERVYSSPVKLGSGGLIDTEHGKLPLPGPAVSEILKGYPTVLTSIPYELTTPTGAAIVKALSYGVLSDETLVMGSVGYGAGTRELPDAPNVLRVVLGELDRTHGTEELVIVEANIDDMNPEIAPYVVGKLLAAGAADAFIVPLIMKKGRPGFMISAMSAKERLDAVLSVMFAETTTIGVRMHAVKRRTLPRSTREVVSSLGKVVMKVVVSEGTERLIPEFEECRRLAELRGIPLRQVYGILEREFSAPRKNP